MTPKDISLVIEETLSSGNVPGIAAPAPGPSGHLVERAPPAPGV